MWLGANQALRVVNQPVYVSKPQVKIYTRAIICSVPNAQKRVICSKNPRDFFHPMLGSDEGKLRKRT
jgi:hypothetical protein